MNSPSQHLDVQFFLRDGKNPAFGTVYVRITYGTDRVEIGSTGIRINRAFWNARRRLVKASCPDAEALNLELDRWRERLAAARLDLLRKGREPITAGSIKTHLLDERGGFLTMTGLVDWYLAQKAGEVGTRITKSSYQAFAQRGRNIKAFLLHARLTQQLADEFTSAIADKLVTYFVQERTYKNSYVNKHLDLLKTMLRAAFDADRISENPLKRYADLPEDDPDTTYLTDEEITRWDALTDLTPRLEKCRDFLLVCVEIGTHYVDYVGLVRRGRIDTDPDGTRWIMGKRQKTEKPIEVPVTPRLERLLAKYGGLNKLPTPALSQLNAFLKPLAERALITKAISTKIGRKSFADARMNGDLLSADMTATMLGLTSPAYLKHYGTPRREGIKKALAQAEQRRLANENRNKPDP